MTPPLSLSLVGRPWQFAQFFGTLLLFTGAVSLGCRAQTPNFGSNVLIFDPSMPTSQIQAAVDTISAQQISNQFGTQRYALLFKPGVYGTAAAPLDFQVGFYTEVAGLGASPGDVTINGHVDVYNQCFPVAAGQPAGCRRGWMSYWGLGWAACFGGEAGSGG